MPERTGHFESPEVEAHAARLGMWTFLASELLLFAGLFTLYSASRAHDPAGFHAGIVHSARIIGSTNTAILLTSSLTMALAVHELRESRRSACVRLVLATAGLGVIFLCLKGLEYALHLTHGIAPGGGRPSAYEGASTLFWSLYFVMTGIHAIHVLVGVGLLMWSAQRVRRGRIQPESSHRLHVVAMYWHLVDVIWIFLWPLFYLA